MKWMVSTAAMCDVGFVHVVTMLDRADGLRWLALEGKKERCLNLNLNLGFALSLASSKWIQKYITEIELGQNPGH
jgi:hypothetical protein